MDTTPHRYGIVTGLTPQYKTIQEALLQLEHCQRQGARFVQRSGDAPFYPYNDVLGRAKSAAAAFQALGVRRGDRIAIILPTCIEFMDAFLGAMLAGAIPSALYPPVHLGKLDEYFARTRRMIEKIGAKLVVTDRRIRLLLGPLADAVSPFCDIVDADKLSGAAAWTPVEIDADSPAFLQFSSGTTLEPKAVIISHKNLLSNLAMIDELFATFSDEEVERGGVCWLPLYHDMGLIGCMFIGLYHPGTVTYIGPDLFIARPRVWFETLSRYKAVVSAAPDFAYALCTSKIKDEDLNGIDLSHWKIAFNGAEPIDANVITRFSDRFAKWGLRRQTMTPGYGLAEAGLAVSFASPSDPPRVTEFDATRLAEDGQAVIGRGRKIVSVGKPVTGLVVEVQDDAGQPVPSGRVGRIMVRGPSVTPGYFNDPQLSAALIRNNWLDTGDQGFVHDGELHISGRLKDLVIIRGRNYAPQQIEHLVTGVSGLRIASTAAISCPSEGGGERLVVIAERDADCQRTDDELVAEITEKITAGVSLVPGDVRIVKPGTIPRTSSGKLRRSELLRLYQSGRLTAPDKVDGLFLAKKLGKSQLAWGKLWLKKLMRLSALAFLLALGFAAPANAATCDLDGVQSSGAIYRICMPPEGKYNGRLVIWAHGFQDAGTPVQIPEDQLCIDGICLPDIITNLGFGFATTSYSKTGLAVLQGQADVLDLVQVYAAQKGTPAKVYLVGASEGGLVTALSLEQSPDVFSAGLAACGPIGSFPFQINYFGDARATFEFFFPGLIPGSPFEPDPWLAANWSQFYETTVAPVVFDPANSNQLDQWVRVAKLPYDAADYLNTVKQSVADVLRYSVVNVTDAGITLGGNPFDNRRRVYRGSDHDPLLNLLVPRVDASPAAIAEMHKYDTTAGLVRPLITIHTLRDQQVPYTHEQLYNLKTYIAGTVGKHLNIPIDRFEHCNFTKEELLFTFGVMLRFDQAIP